MTCRWSLATLLLCTAAIFRGAPEQATPSTSRILSLRPEEGVFAYSRISPDGRHLAYASETRRPDDPSALVQTVRVVELPRQNLVFSEAGIDAYWSPDGERLIFLSFKDGGRSITIWHKRDGRLSRDVVPPVLGDYYSWGSSGGTDTILTVKNNYFTLNGDKGVLPASRVPACPGAGTGERPLISRDGRLITTFVRGTIVIRSLASCDHIVYTHTRGAKADFSSDGRYVAFHAPKRTGAGYELVVVDAERRTQRRLTGMAGSSLFPSWTNDGRVAFRYDGPDYRGFMMTSGILALPEEPLASRPLATFVERWQDLFPSAGPPSRWTLVLIWASWSAHSSIALRAAQHVGQQLANQGIDVSILTAVETASEPSDVLRLRREHRITLPLVPLLSRGLADTEAMNQIPAALLFERDRLVDRRLGALETPELRRWLQGHLRELHDHKRD